MATQPLPLEGIRVVDYSHFLAAPYLSRCLAAMGADVIKVERPTEGDAGRKSPYQLPGGYSGYFLQHNMGKRGLCVNMKDPRGADLVNRLIDGADVMVENYRPGALAKFGLGYEQLSERNPELVYCSISAYGHTGPYASRPGFGLIAEAISGGMAMIGEEGTIPPLLSLSVADMYAGIHGVAAITSALLGRVRSGRGQHIDISLYDCMVSIHDYAVQNYTLSDGGVLPKRMGRNMPTSSIYGSFAARDGYFVLAAQVDDLWLKLAGVVGGDELVADTRYHTLAGRNEHASELLARIDAWALAQPSVRDCLAQLDAAGVPCTKIQTIDEVVNDPQIVARGMIIEQEHPVLGTIKLPNLPFRFSECDTMPTRVAPGLGEHNAEIAAELGYSQNDIADMQADQVLYAPPA